MLPVSKSVTADRLGDRFCFAVESGEKNIWLNIKTIYQNSIGGEWFKMMFGESPCTIK